MKQGLRYFLRYCFTWLFELWLRPIDIIEESRRNNSLVVAITNITSCVLLGCMLGSLYWLLSGDIRTIWILLVVFTILSSSASVTVSGDAVGGSLVIGLIVIVLFANSFINAFTGIAFLLNIIAFIGCFQIEKTIISTFVGNLFLVVLVFSSYFLKKWLFLENINYFIYGFIGINLLLAFFIKKINWVQYVLIFNFFLLMPAVSIIIFPHTTIYEVFDIKLIALLVIFLFSINIFFGLYYYDKKYKINQLDLLKVFFLFFLMLAGICLLTSSFVNSDLSINLKLLAKISTIAPVIATGLPFWLFMAFIALWQYRTKNINSYTRENFLLTAPFRWQSFAYPLPSLANYLFQLGQHNIENSLTAIRLIQDKTLQDKAAETAIIKLINDEKTAFYFCAEAMLQHKTETIRGFSLVSPIGRIIGSLPKQYDENEEKNLQDYLNGLKEYPLNKLPYIFRFYKEKNTNTEIEDFISIRKKTLLDRLEYAKYKAQTFKSYIGYKETLNLITVYQIYLIKEFSDISKLSFISFSIDYPQKWLCYGYIVLNKIINVVSILKDYPELITQTAKQESLLQIVVNLKNIDLDGCSDYWKVIGFELSQHWITLLGDEISHAKGWLELEINLEKNNYSLGTQNLLLKVVNPTNITARNLQIQVEDNEVEITWHHKEMRLKFLETQQQEIIKLEFECQTIGEYRISGELTAEDITNAPYQLPFSFQINIEIKGNPYQIPDFQPYIIGEGVGDDRTFVERKELFYWLHSYWKQPEGKPAIALMGQRRMGKTSLLNKIQRSGLAELKLIPILIDLQDGIESDYVFLNTTAQKMAITINQPVITLATENSYAAFSDFLQALKLPLANNRFLLMLDEAELIFNARFTSQLADFLRALMQGHQYPVLVLFCGTYLLQRLSREYYSIFFNTVQFKKVSYMNAQESAEVLTKPSRDILQFDPDSLTTAFQLTRGQPLLLQTLGTHLIENFNQAVWNGEQRSHYVSLNDLDKAAKTLVENGSSAFEQHWQDNQGAAHYVLSALAWTIDEVNRPRLDMNGLLNIMQEKHLLVTENQVFSILERLVEEEILVREGVAYHFAVPLYRRWIAWRWSPELVRNEVL